MELNQYQAKVRNVDTYPTDLMGTMAIAFASHKEMGEISALLEKAIRKGFNYRETRSSMKGKLGDALCQLSLLASRFNLDLEEVGQSNSTKRSFLEK